MSVKKEASGRRSIQVEMEVPGTPDEVWQAIATGPGISAWFVPTTVEEDNGKPVAQILDYGNGMTFRNAVTVWNAPTRFVREGPGWAPGSPPIATEFTVQARAGGVCVVRVVQSLFSSTDDWDGQLTGAEEGWPGIGRILNLYMAHFRGQHSAIARVMVPVAGTAADAWAKLTAALGLSDARIGQRWSVPAGVPPLGGVLEYMNDRPYGALIRLDTPATGVAGLGTISFGDMVMASFTFYFYGEQADENAVRAQSVWQAWTQECLSSMTASDV